MLNTAASSTPHGRVSLLFTDIEGSTELLERLHEQYGQVLEQHRDILRAAFGRHNGYEVDTQGDSFFVAFGQAGDAVACAVDIQRAVAAHGWPGGEPVRIRIGIHTGEPTLAPTGYVGIDVHRGARIGAAAHGGQVLVSDATRAALGGGQPVDVELVALGVFHFKGLAERLAVLEVRAPGLATGFPPIRLSPPEDEPPVAGEPPYKGLLRFDEEDAGLFFGREQLIAQVLAAVRTKPFLAVVGASGSGKSSLIRAGVIPALKEQAGWRTLIMTPTADPVGQLTEILGETPSTDLLRRLADTGQLTVLVIDQFEEVFTLCRDDAARREFVAFLTTAPSETFRVLLTLRADFYAEVAQFAQLRDAIAEHQLYVGPMSPEEMLRAIEEPARLGGWELAPGLADLLVRDVAEEPGALPLLSHALLETWRRRRGFRMTLRGYFESGEVRGAIARTADRLYAELQPDEQLAARAILMRLTELGEGTQDTRRRALLDELVPAGGEDSAVGAADVLRRLVDARLVTIDEGAVEVAHEALIREWPLLREWLHEDREGLRALHQISDAAAEWQSLNREPSLLYRGARLATAREWANDHPRSLNSREREFLDASIENEEREEREREEQQRKALDAAQRAAESERLRAEQQAAANRRLRRRAVVLTGAVIVAAALGVAAIVFAGQASQQTAQAQTEASIADQQRNDADQQRQTADQQRQLAQQNQAEAQKQQQIAEQNQAQAQQQQQIAEQNQAEAEKQQQIAQQNQAEAEKQQRIALSRQLAVQSLASGRDLDLSLLLAVQAANTSDTTEARSSLFAALTSEPRLTRFVPADGDTIEFDEAGDVLVARNNADDDFSVWNQQTRQRLSTFATGILAWSSAISPDGKYFATSDLADASVQLWQLPSGAPVGPRLNGHVGAALGLAFSPDSRTLFTGGFRDRSIVSWDVATQTQIGEPMSDNSDCCAPIYSLAISPDGRTLASGSPTDLALFDTTSRQQISQSRAGAATALVFSPDGKTLAFNDETSIFLMDVASRKVIDSWNGQAGEEPNPQFSTPPVGVMAFNEDGSLLAYGRDDGTIAIRDVASRQTLTDPLVGPSSPVGDVSFDNATNQFVSITPLRGAAFWSLTPIPRIATHLDDTPGLAAAFISPGVAASSSANDGSLSLWNTQQMTNLSTTSLGETAAPSGSPGGTSAIVPADDGESVLTVTSGSVQLFDVGNGARVGDPFYASDDGDLAPLPSSVAVSRDGRTAISARGSGHVVEIDVFDLVERKQTSTLEINDALPEATVAVSSDGRLGAAGLGDGTIAMWNLGDGSLIRTIQPSVFSSVDQLIFSADGKSLIADDNGIRVWSVDTGEQIGPILHQQQDSTLIGLSVTDDDRMLASIADDQVLTLWDWAQGQVIGQIPGVTGAALSGDGLQLITTGDAGTDIWDLNVDDWRAKACDVVGRSLTQDEWQRYLPGEPYSSTCP